MKALHITLVLLLAMLTQGCVSAAMTGANVLYDRENIGDTLDNQYLGLQAGQQLAAFKRRNPDANITLAAINETILMAGQVPNEAAKKEADKLVKQVPDAKIVYNDLTVGEASPFSQQATDAWITTKIVTQYMTHMDLNPRNIKVVTENGIVYLLGDVEREDGAIATSIARQTDGVKQVVLLFRYMYFA